MPRAKIDRLRVFISSPNDVADIRDVAEGRISEINKLIGNDLGAFLDVVRWESDIAPDMGRPQEVINEQSRIADCDLFVGIIGARFGTPTGAYKPDGMKAYLSGTEEEFTIAYESWQRIRSPRIMLYRKISFDGDLRKLDATQFQRVDEFFRRFRSEGDTPGLVKEIQDASDFSEQFSSDIVSAMRDIVATKIPDKDAVILPQPFQSMGVEKLFLPAHNHFREEEKRDLLFGTRDIRLIANSGHSFLALVGHRYRTQLTRELQDGAMFKAILANPWSETGLAIACQERDDRREISGSLFDYSASSETVQEIISESKWYSVKYRDSIDGLTELSDSYQSNTEFRITNYPMTSTIFMTEKGGSFEPYTNIGTSNRYRVGMLISEIFFNDSSYLYDYCSRYFEEMFESAIGIESFRENEKEFEKSFLSRFSGG